VCPRSTRTHHFSKAVALLVARRVLVLRQIANALIEHYKRLSEFRAYDRPRGSYPKTGVMSGLATILPDPGFIPRTIFDE
jgi:hypothetical protein